MARSTDINQRIVLTGADEVRKGLDQIAAAGQRSGNLTRAALLGALGPTTDFTAGINAAAEAHRGLSAQGQAVFHSVRSVTEQLALGVSPAQAFTQQLNHLSFAATGPGGISGAFGELKAGLAAFVTPTTAAIAGFAALAGGLAFLISRAASAENATRQFDVILQGMHRNTQVTGKQLEEAAHSFRDLGISAGEGRKAIADFLQAGGNPNQAKQVVRIAADVEAVLGQGKMQEFIAAAAKGGEPLQEFARQLGVIPRVADDTQKQLDEAAQSARKFGQSVDDVLHKRALSITEQQRQLKQDLFDLTRERGTQEEELQLASSRRIQDIIRQSNQSINDLIIQRNRENAAQLAAYNKSIEDAAQKALDTGQGLLNQIEQAVSGSNQRALTPFQETIRALNKAWNDLLDTMAKSDVIQGIARDITEMVRSITDAIKWLDQLGQAIRNIPGLPAVLGGSGSAGQPAATPPIPPVQSAAGGLIRGPGGPTGDQIAARLSDYEFVSRARAVRTIGADVYAAINAYPERFAGDLRRLVSGVRGFAAGGLASFADSVHEAIAVPRFATGGLVTVPAGVGGRSGFTIVLDGRAFPASADRNVAESLHRTARQKQIVSAGRKPGYRA